MTRAPPTLKEASCVQKSSSWLSCCLTFSPRFVRFAYLGALSTGLLSTLGMPAETMSHWSLYKLSETQVFDLAMRKRVFELALMLEKLRQLCACRARWHFTFLCISHGISELSLKSSVILLNRISQPASTPLFYAVVARAEWRWDTYEARSISEHCICRRTQDLTKARWAWKAAENDLQKFENSSTPNADSWGVLVNFVYVLAPTLVWHHQAKTKVCQQALTL